MSKKPPQTGEQRKANLAGLKHELAEIAAKVNGKPSLSIRPCRQVDFEAIYTIVNDAAEACRGVIPEDCWKTPYMSWEELRSKSQ